MHPESPHYRGPKDIRKDTIIVICTPIVGISTGDDLNFKSENVLIIALAGDKLNKLVDKINNSPEKILEMLSEFADGGY